jgi:hypothetical protein
MVRHGIIDSGRIPPLLDALPVEAGQVNQVRERWSRILKAAGATR